MKIVYIDEDERGKPKIKGYFLGLVKMCMNSGCANFCRDSSDDVLRCTNDIRKFYRWIEHNAIAYKLINSRKAEILLPLGGVRILSPYKQYDSREEIMRQKDILNCEIVRKNEPHNWFIWGITDSEQMSLFD